MNTKKRVLIVTAIVLVFFAIIILFIAKTRRKRLKRGDEQKVDETKSIYRYITSLSKQKQE